MTEFGIRIADVAQQSRELGTLASARVEAERIRYRRDEFDDMAAVASRVVVVCVDDVAEQQRGSAIGVRELESVVQPSRTLLREDAQEDKQWDRQQERRRPSDRH